MNESHLPRFEAVQRRAFLKRMTMLGAAGLVPGLACSADDSEVFAASSTTTAASAAGAETPTTAGATSTTAAPDTIAAEPATTTTVAASGGELPAGAQLEVAFTYAVASGGFGQVRNPFIAVWIENAAGELVRNISLWYEAGKGERWLNELPSWYAADQTYFDANQTLDYESVSGATRSAGSYTVVWDGSEESGGRAAAGDFVVFIESAREHGSHSITSTPITLGTSATKAAMPDQGDLSDVTVSYTV